MLAMDKVTANIGELAMSELKSAMDGLAKVPTPPADSSTSSETPVTSDEKKEKGCGSAISGSGLTILLGVAVVKFIKRKKED